MVPDMFANLESPPDVSDEYSWADFLELRSLIHPDKCFTRGELSSLITRTKSTGKSAKDPNEIWSDVKGFIRSRRAEFGHSYPFNLSQDEDTIELVDSALTEAQLFYLTLLICSSMAYLPSKANIARVFEECCLIIFKHLMPKGSEVHAAWASGGSKGRYRGNLPQKYEAIAKDIRATATFKARDFKTGDHGDGGIDIVAWHPMGDLRDSIPSALAQCGCSREDWRRKHLEASPSKLRAKLNPHHPWANYYFMPIDLRWADGDWANKSDFGDAIMVDRLRLLRLADQFKVIKKLPIGQHVITAHALAIM
jgi:hypothetical protein